MNEMWKRHIVPSSRLLDMVGRIVAKERDYPRAESLLKRMWSLNLVNANSLVWMFQCLMSSSKQIMVASERREKAVALLELCKKNTGVHQTFRLTKTQVIVLAELGMFPESIQVINEFRSGYNKLSYWNRSKAIPRSMRNLPLYALECAMTSIFVRNGIASGNLEPVKLQVLEWIQESPQILSPKTLLFLLQCYGDTLEDLPTMVSILDAVFQHDYQDKWTVKLESPIQIQARAYFVQPRLTQLILRILRTRTDGGSWVMLRSSLVTCIQQLEAEIRLLTRARPDSTKVPSESRHEYAEQMFLNDRLALLEYVWSNTLEVLVGLKHQYVNLDFHQVSSDIEIIIQMMNEKSLQLSAERSAVEAEGISAGHGEMQQHGQMHVEEASSRGLLGNDENERAVRLVGRRSRPRPTIMDPATA